MTITIPIGIWTSSISLYRKDKYKKRARREMEKKEKEKTARPIHNKTTCWPFPKSTQPTQPRIFLFFPILIRSNSIMTIDIINKNSGVQFYLIFLPFWPPSRTFGRMIDGDYFWAIPRTNWQNWPTWYFHVRIPERRLISTPLWRGP